MLTTLMSLFVHWWGEIKKWICHRYCIAFVVFESLVNKFVVCGQMMTLGCVLQGKGLLGTFNSSANKITMFAPVDAAFSQNLFSVSSQAIVEL